MKKLLNLLALLSITSLSAQKDTLYFNSAWNKTTKEDATFFRPLPLKKVGKVYQVKDFYSNGVLQMEGFWTDVENEVLEGKATWYHENGQKSEETFSENGIEKTRMVYKNNQPDNGDMYRDKSEVDFGFGYESIVSLFHYESGIKTGNQYDGYFDESGFIVSDTIQFKLGKPYQGREIAYDEKFRHVHVYKKGKLIETILQNLAKGEIEFFVTYSNEGYIITHIKSNFSFCEVTYVDNKKQNGRVILYPKRDSKGTLEYQGNKIIIIDLAFNEAGFYNEYAIEESRLVIKAKKERLNFKMYPKLDIDNTYTYKGFLPDSEGLFFTGKGEAVADFYINKSENPISSCITKNHKPYQGTVVQYDDGTDTFSVRKYEKGKRSYSTKELSEKELIKLLN